MALLADWSGIHCIHKLTSTLAHWHGQCRLHLLPARCGHHLNSIEGFWRAMKDAIGSGRGFADLHQGLMAHQERPIYEFS